MTNIKRSTVITSDIFWTCISRRLKIQNKIRNQLIVVRQLFSTFKIKSLTRCNVWLFWMNRSTTDCAGFWFFLAGNNCECHTASIYIATLLFATKYFKKMSRSNIKSCRKQPIAIAKWPSQVSRVQFKLYELC